MPPKMNSVIPRMGSPYRRATREWESSWKTIEARMPTAQAAPIAQYRDPARSG